MKISTLARVCAAPAIIGLLLIASGCGGANIQTTPGGNQERKLVFSSNRALDGSDAVNDASNIWIINSDGSVQPLTALTASKADSDNPVWSPDGNAIAYDSGRALDGSNAAIEYNYYPGWKLTNIWIMNADGTGTIPLTNLLDGCCRWSTAARSPVWSPDGSKLAYTEAELILLFPCDNNYNPGSRPTGAPKYPAPYIWVMNANGTNAAPLTHAPCGGASTDGPVWSPDGARIVFDSNWALDRINGIWANGANNIWVMNADGAGAKPLTTLKNANSSGPVWSPDGRQIAFISQRALDGSDAPNRNNAANLWIMNADGTSAKPLTRLTAIFNPCPSYCVLSPSVQTPAWSPDGSKIAFVSLWALDGSDAASPNGTPNIWVINADGTRLKPLTLLTASGAGSSDAAWSPDGKEIAFDSSRALDGSDAANINGTSNIWVIDADGANATPVAPTTATGIYNGHPQWRP